MSANSEQFSYPLKTGIASESTIKLDKELMQKLIVKEIVIAIKETCGCEFSILVAIQSRRSGSEQLNPSVFMLKRYVHIDKMIATITFPIVEILNVESDFLQINMQKKYINKYFITSITIKSSVSGNKK